MLLQRLNEYADRLDLPPALYSEVSVRYIIELDATGRLRNPQPVDTSDPTDKRTRRGERHLVPQVQRAYAIKPLLLADNAEYTLGLAREKSRPERVAQCHEAYVDLLSRCLQRTEEPAVAAVLAFLRTDPTAQLELPDDFDRSATLTFRVDGCFPVDLPSVQAFWAAENDPAAAASRPARVMQCLVCGQERPVLDRLQGKIKGIPGGQTAGTAIISANEDAFLSYGLKASLIAPTCASCGERFTKAANALLADERHRIFLGGVAFIFWTREEVDFLLGDFLSSPDPAQVRDLLASVRSGRRVADFDDTALYAAAFSASKARAVVRDWIDTTVGEVKAHLSRWFKCQWIVDAYGDEPRPLGVDALARATLPESRKDPPTPTSRVLLRAALTGTPLPVDLLYQAVRRNRTEQDVTYSRAALIKLVWLSRHPTSKEDDMVRLDPEHPEPAYHCGRLLAVLESAQRRALPGINTTIVDRYYGAASTAPASVFGRLLSGSKPHLSKLERDRRDAYEALQCQLEEIMAVLTGFPSTLTLKQQGLFALGYYHQRAYDRAQARAASERRKADLAAASESDDADADLPENKQPTENEENN